MQTALLNIGLTVGLPLLITSACAAAVSFVKSSKSAHAQNLFALGGQVAREACLLAEEKGLHWSGEERFDQAVKTYIKKMSDAGFTVDIKNAAAKVQAAHTEMSLDRTTAYNDKSPSMLEAAAQIAPAAQGN